MQSSRQLCLLKSHICCTLFCTVSEYMLCHVTEHIVYIIPLYTGTYVPPCSAKSRNVQDYIFSMFQTVEHVSDGCQSVFTQAASLHHNQVVAVRCKKVKEQEPQEFVCHQCSRQFTLKIPWKRLSRRLARWGRQLAITNEDKIVRHKVPTLRWPKQPWKLWYFE